MVRKLLGALGLVMIAVNITSADVVTDWNQTTRQAIRVDLTAPPRASRALAISLSADRFSLSRGVILCVGSITAMRVGSPFIEKMIAGTIAKHAARNGISNVPIRNDHFKTTFLYSCFRTAKNFRIQEMRIEN